MLKFNSQHYVFPDINYFTSIHRKPDTIKLSKLNWSYSSQYKTKKFHEWRTVNDSLTEFVPELPPKWEDFLNEQVFAMNLEMLDEIQFHVMQGVLNSDRKKLPFIHTNFTFDSTIKSFEIAFRLLGDCLYDIQRKKWASPSSKALISSILLFKFWAHQIAPNKSLDHSDQWSFTTNLWDLSLMENLKKSYIDELTIGSVDKRTIAQRKKEKIITPFLVYSQNPIVEININEPQNKEESIGYQFINDITEHYNQFISSYNGKCPEDEIPKLKYETTNLNRLRCRVKIANHNSEFMCGGNWYTLSEKEKAIEKGNFQYQYGYALEMITYAENVIEPTVRIEFDKLKTSTLYNLEDVPDDIKNETLRQLRIKEIPINKVEFINQDNNGEDDYCVL